MIRAVIFDLDWLYATERSDDFAEGLKYWATHKILVRPPIYDRWYHHNYNRTDGAVLIDHPESTGKKVLASIIHLSPLCPRYLS